MQSASLERTGRQDRGGGGGDATGGSDSVGDDDNNDALRWKRRRPKVRTHMAITAAGAVMSVANDSAAKNMSPASPGAGLRAQQVASLSAARIAAPIAARSAAKIDRQDRAAR